jgi:hypothetical protein
MTLRLIASCAALALVTSPALAGTGGKLVSADGEVWTQAPGGSEARATAGATLAPGTHIRTGDNGRAEVELDDGSKLRVKPRSSLMLSKVKRHKEKVSLLLFFGRVWSKVTKSIGGENKYEVNTPNAVCGVRGTEFTTIVADDGSVRVRVTGGSVGVEGDSSTTGVAAGQEAEADENGVGEAYTAEEQAKIAMWQKRKARRLNKKSHSIVDAIKARIMGRKAKIEALRARQREIESKRKSAESRAKMGDRAAVDQIREYNTELAEIADAIADLGDAAETQFGIVDHFADLAGDPRFSGIDRKYLEAEAASLRRIKASLDKLVAEGTDISIEAMDKMLEEYGDGARGTLKDEDSAADDLFGDDPF